MKIAFYINDINGGGAERVMVNLANYLSEIGREVVFVTSYRSANEYKLSSKVKRLSIENNQINQSRFKRNLSRVLALRQICKNEKPSVLVTFMAEPNFRGIIATLGLPVKTIVSVRNDPNREYAGKIGKFVGKWILPIADGCVFQTKEAQEWFPESLQRKSTIIFNAVKEEFFHIERKPVAGEIITCGRLETQKNHKLLIDAFAEVVKEHPYARLKIYGEGSLRDVLQEQIDNFGLQDKAFLMGATNDVAKALQTADLFVLSSDYEGMPNALMEAMAVGVPCISTDCPCGGPRELFRELLYNQLISIKDKNSMAEKIDMFLSADKEGKKRLARKTKELAKCFSSIKINSFWENYIESTMDNVG